jgi:hypothetical protein
LAVALCPVWLNQGRRADRVRAEPAGDPVKRGFRVPPRCVVLAERQLRRRGRRRHKSGGPHAD